MTAPDEGARMARGARVTVLTKWAPAFDLGDALLSKRISLVDGRVLSDGSACQMATGDAEVADAATAEDLAQLIAGLGSSNALALGSIKDHQRAQVVTVSELKTLRARVTADGLPIIARSRQYIDYPDGFSWLLIDFDKKGMPDEISAAVAAAGGVWAALVSIAPGLARTARATRASTSAGLRRGDTGEEIAGSGGQHHYVLVQDGGDIDRALAALHELCWLHGFGWYLIGKAGQLLDRTIIDSSVRFGERLVFEGPPEVVPPLFQDAAARLPVAHGGEAIDTRSAIRPLTAYQAACVMRAKQRAGALLEPEAAKVRAQADQLLAKEISDKTRMPLASAMRVVAARHRGALLPHIMLDFDDLGLISVATVLADPDKYVGESLADPLEGVDYGRCKAMVLLSRDDPAAVFINSFAHGGARYRLRHDMRTAHAAIDNAEPAHVVDELCAILPQAEIEADERTSLIAAVAAKAKVGVRVIQARLKEEEKRRIAAKQARVHEQRLACESRPTYPLPPADAERGPIIRLVDDALAADLSEEPPMRDASGALVAVRMREPWGLHLLTATGSNAEARPDAGVESEDFSQSAPPEPLIDALSAVQVGLLVEEHICFEKEATAKRPSYAAALQAGYIEALMQMGAESAMPIIRAINTAPLVARNGNVMTGVGLDRQTGLFHHIEPLLRDCVPTTIPTEEEVREALYWLLNVWLVDVNADITTKLLALMLCLSMVERVLLKERPGWFITAGHRGGGKTTLINMLTTAVLGRMAAAAGWSDNEEERRKALFSYLRQSVAVVCWDNIPRGAKITSACIEKALTSPEISDHVLGESTFETAPGGTVQIFTGNNVGPKGDMCSRSFSLMINVDRPDPENRDFVHPDPIGWTEQHRQKILRCLYAILIYGCRNRPKGQIAKTRFKDWWSLCGWPIEHAASLIGETIDCTILFKAGENDDEETSAASVMLSTLLDEFEADKPFGAKSIVDIIEAGSFSWERLIIPPEKKERAGKLLDAFAELLGRQLDRPTAGTLGKLLNNRLVDRPTPIDGGRVATLKKFETGHTGQYYLSVADTVRPRPESADAAQATAETKPPTSPISPQSPGGTVSRGDEGDAGDRSDAPATREGENQDDLSVFEELIV